MANSLQKLPIQENINKIAVQRAYEAIQMSGKSFPCVVQSVNGALVTVAFDMDTSPWNLQPITIPKAESNWIRNPTQVGDTGITIPADVFLDKISGQDTFLPDMTQPPNLSALLFLPVSSLAFGSSPNANAALIQGPQGAVIQTTDGTSSVVVNASGITLSFGGNSIVINSSGVIINGINFSSHVHGGVQTGGGNTGGPM